MIATISFGLASEPEDSQYGKYRWIDRKLTGLAGPDYDTTISFRLASEPEDSQYGKYRIRAMHPATQSHRFRNSRTAVHVMRGAQI